MLKLFCLLAMWLPYSALAAAQEPAPVSGETRSGIAEVPEVPEEGTSEESEEHTHLREEATEVAEPPSQGRAAGENLLGQVDTARGEGRRNENVQINLVDNNAARDSAQRVGPTATIVDEFRVERSYYSAEYGNAGRGLIHAQTQRGAGIHGNVSWNHGNSIFSSRAFFQAGSVQPARQNQFGAGLNAGLWKGAFFSFNGTGDVNRGNVNGNILIPLPEERVVLATDPTVRQIVQSWIDAYPNVAPNRPDIAARALNTNSPQLTDTIFTNGQFNQKIGGRDTLAARYGFTGQDVDAFQFVKGQNPNTHNKSHTARLTWDRVWNPTTTGDFSIGLDRTGVLLIPAENAVGPVYINGLSTIGPQNNIPVNRAINNFRANASVQARRGRHSWTFGGGGTRLYYNGDEPDGARPVWTIREDFGNQSIMNMRLGLPYQLSKAFGDSYRAYRNWDFLGFVGDHFQVSDRLTLSYGTRWEPVTKPTEQNNRFGVAMDSDWNNIGGNFGAAYRLTRGGQSMGVLRGAYGAMFGQIFPATYGQDRLNPPYYSRVNLNAPNMVDPFAGLTPADLDPAQNARGMRFDISPALATPYAFQYNLSWEAEVHPGWRVQVGYVGSRSVKLFQTFILNRARYVEGVPYTTATINQRRPNPAMNDQFYSGNFSRASYNAGRVGLTVPRWHGITLNTSYWRSRAIDLGGDYVTTGAGNERFGSGGQTGENVHEDMKGRSSFDQPHAFMLQASYDTGRYRAGIFSSLIRNWNVSGVYLLKSGTPFNITSGADGPGLGNVDGSNGDRPIVLDRSVIGRTVGNPGNAQELLPKSAFRFIRAPQEQAGDLPRNAFRKGRIANLNASISRTWTIWNDYQIMFRAESINFTNTAQFAEPNNSLASPAFGQITNTLNDGRTFRFNLRVSF
ncbi:MAG: hypothetical protein ABL967_13785 [Bryobacteraceae bacterium]